jgi:hypothetical protein
MTDAEIAALTETLDPVMAQDALEGVQAARHSMWITMMETLAALALMNEPDQPAVSIPIAGINTPAQPSSITRAHDFIDDTVQRAEVYDLIEGNLRAIIGPDEDLN